MDFATILRKVFAGAIASLFLAAGVQAGTTGKIAGKVFDLQSKEAMIGVNVVLVGTMYGAATDPGGNYFIINIPPGTYQVKASGVGYAATMVSNVKVNADQTTHIDFSLQSVAVEIGAVEVTATRPIVQKDITSTTATVSSDQLKTLPLEDVQAVVNLQAGVVEGHFRGGRSNEVKYLIDGVPVNDVFTGNSTLAAEVSSIQEIQVLSGTFNAEYGEALSGVVNQITKIAGEKYTGQVSAYGGDYLSTRSDVFQHIDALSLSSRSSNSQKPLDVYNVEGNISGPIIPGSRLLKFFASGRYVYDNGAIYGKRVFNPKDSSWATGDNPPVWNVVATGDGKYVPMNWSERGTVQGKLSLDAGSAGMLTLNGLYQANSYRVYDHQFQLNPDGDYHYYQKSFLGSANFNHVFSDAAFLEGSLSLFESDYKQYVFENPQDPGYTDPLLMNTLGANTFLTGGTQNWHFLHHTNTYTGKIDITDQVTHLHQLKGGIQYQYHTLRDQNYQVQVTVETGYQPQLPPAGSFVNNNYSNHPSQLAAYLQDKIELDYLIVNVGLRYDWFQPDGSVLIDPNNIAALDTLAPPYPSTLFRKASAKSQFSPRIGLSYPMSDKGAIHISYGHFFQIPAFEFLYKNPTFRIADHANFPDYIGNTIGNADLEPQRTTIYEIGLQQEIAPDLGVTVTAYYKDIRDLLGLQLYQKQGISTFGEYTNRDYGSVTGFTFSIEKRFSGGFGGTLDYTFQNAEGNASDPSGDLAKQLSGVPVNKELAPLDWDRRHSLNLTLSVGSPDNFNASFISRLGSGLPYTPSLFSERTGSENSDNRPTYFSTDLYLTKYIRLMDKVVSVFLKIYNLFDNSNEVNVFTDTGRAGYTLDLTRQQEQPRGVNTLQEFFTRPDFYSAPRQVVLGATVSF
jgi:outer membrane receptor protein involved in Fe transport